MKNDNTKKDSFIKLLAKVLDNVDDSDIKTKLTDLFSEQDKKYSENI